MTINIEEIKQETSRDTYWTRIRFCAEDEQSTSVLVCASREYLWNEFGRRNFSNDLLVQWISAIGTSWQARGRQVFSSPVHYDVYAMTNEGRRNGLQFLQLEVRA